MNERWTTLPNAPSVLRHADDVRPAWLWSGDGQQLLWSNAAAGLFHAKIKKHGLKRIAGAVPIKGQVSRIIRLGHPGRSSLARIQFLAGEKPISATCTTTPLAWENGEVALLIVAVDPIADEILAAAAREGGIAEAGDAPLPEPVEPVAPIEPEAATADESYAHELQSWQEADAESVYEPVIEPLPPAEDIDAPQDWQAALADDAVAEKPAVDAEQEQSRFRNLSALVERLAADEALFTPLGTDDDQAPTVAPALDDASEEADETPTLFKVTGKGFKPRVADLAETPEPPTDDMVAEQGDAPAPPVEEQPDAEMVERVSRYNFDELSRILSDRVGERNLPAPEPAVTPPAAPAQTGSLINLGGETLVLNRLPLGILVFRDQQILFANRAITEMVGYESVESLRQAGLAAVFPSIGDGEQEAGPVNHLVTRDGALVPVTARLQSISWQGRPALMLSASTTEVRTGHEEAVRAFAQTFADLRGDGFIEANRSGMVSGASASTLALLGDGRPMTGRALSSLVGEDDALALRGFLERPARFAETARPALPLRSADGKADILLFALGQAGVISGYFGIVHARETAPARLSGPSDIDPALLARISRGVRRPLNTIVGFSDLISSQAFGVLGNERYEGYAEDISRAGREIAALVDELDDYARLRDGRYLPQRASLDLTSLLESCVIRVRSQANANRVIVRNAISETLPRVTADRASLGQAVLNLLASAIDQTPAGSVVVISAQRHDDGAIAIHVRDSSAHAVDMAERFVVFRDGVDRDGHVLTPIRSSVGLALTRSLLAVNAVSLSVDPAGAEGLLFSLKIPADLVDDRPALPQREEN